MRSCSHACMPVHARKRPRPRVRMRALAGRARTSTCTRTGRLAFKPWPCFPVHTHAHAQAWPAHPARPPPLAVLAFPLVAQPQLRARAHPCKHWFARARMRAHPTAGVRRPQPQARPAHAPPPPAAAAPPAPPARLSPLHGKASSGVPRGSGEGAGPRTHATGTPRTPPPVPGAPARRTPPTAPARAAPPPAPPPPLAYPKGRFFSL